MIRPPSVQRTYQAFFSGDPAIVQLPADATDDQRKEHAHRLKVALETGDWGPILSGEGDPTRFTLRFVPGDIFEKIIDRAILPNDSQLRIGPREYGTLLVRAALIEVSNAGDLQIKFDKHPWLGRIASAETVNELYAIDRRIIGELAEYVQERQTLDPKS